MTHWPPNKSIIVSLAIASVCVLTIRADGQVPNALSDRLPASLRAAQHLQEQSGVAIDSLVQQSQQGSAKHQWGNDLRDTKRISGQQNVSQVPSVRPATYSHPTAEAANQLGVAQSDAAWDKILQRSAAASQQHGVGKHPVELAVATDESAAGTSFIDRESAESVSPDAGEANGTAVLVKRISINLMFVLAIAFGVLLLIRQWQKGRSVRPSKDQRAQDALNVCQIIPLANGASLHVVQGTENKFVVAIDGGGIKSVNVLSASFEDTMTQVETREQRRQSRQSKPQLAQHTASPSLGAVEQNEFDPNEDTTEIDEKLIKLLLQRPPAA
jgi:flagellar biogenesis protein FliO